MPSQSAENRMWPWSPEDKGGLDLFLGISLGFPRRQREKTLAGTKPPRDNNISTYHMHAHYARTITTSQEHNNGSLDLTLVPPSNLQ